jgi:hypothetical protein
LSDAPDIHATRWRHALLAWCALCAWGCADVRFEKSPYAIRGLEVVYSEQEDLTFLSWRLRDEADPGKVRFELNQSDQWLPLDLDEAPFPAEPYECDGDYLCFQYQLSGRYRLEDVDERPLRSIHDTEGLYAGGVPRFQRVERTFGIDPIALDRNATIDPKRFDWFAQNAIPLERDYTHQLVGSSRGYGEAGGCAEPSPGAWRALGSRVDPRDGWVEEPVCLSARPDRQDRPGVVVTVAFPPGAELFSEQQDYVPPEERPPLLYLHLVDLLIRGEARCASARDGLVNEFDDRIGRRSPDAIRLGVFTPTDPETGQPTNGCQQASDQDYPVRQIAELVKAEAARLEPTNVKLVVVYMNNVELPPSEQVLAQLVALGDELASVDNVDLHSLAVGSNAIIGLFPWSDSIGWRPITDETFFGDIENWSEYHLPFRTTLHDPSTPVRVRAPVGARQPAYFKMCAVTPQALTGVEFGPWSDPVDQALVPPGALTFPWTPEGEPSYTTALPTQVLVSFEEYTRQSSSVVVEVCERFCRFPFRAESGTDYGSWLGQRECQWAP